MPYGLNMWPWTWDHWFRIWELRKCGAAHFYASRSRSMVFFVSSVVPSHMITAMISDQSDKRYSGDIEIHADRDAARLVVLVVHSNTVQRAKQG